MSCFEQSEQELTLQEAAAAAQHYANLQCFIQAGDRSGMAYYLQEHQFVNFDDVVDKHTRQTPLHLAMQTYITARDATWRKTRDCDTSANPGSGHDGPLLGETRETDRSIFMIIPDQVLCNDDHDVLVDLNPSDDSTNRAGLILDMVHSNAFAFVTDAKDSSDRTPLSMLLETVPGEKHCRIVANLTACLVSALLKNSYDMNFNITAVRALIPLALEDCAPHYMEVILDVCRSILPSVTLWLTETDTNGKMANWKWIIGVRIIDTMVKKNIGNFDPHVMLRREVNSLLAYIDTGMNCCLDIPSIVTFETLLRYSKRNASPVLALKLWTKNMNCCFSPYNKPLEPNMDTVKCLEYYITLLQPIAYEHLYVYTVNATSLRDPSASQVKVFMLFTNSKPHLHIVRAQICVNCSQQHERNCWFTAHESNCGFTIQNMEQHSEHPAALMLKFDHPMLAVLFSWLCTHSGCTVSTFTHEPQHFLFNNPANLMGVVIDDPPAQPLMSRIASLWSTEPGQAPQQVQPLYKLCRKDIQARIRARLPRGYTSDEQVASCLSLLDLIASDVNPYTATVRAQKLLTLYRSLYVEVNNL